jgi:hypothetical protein
MKIRFIQIKLAVLTGFLAAWRLGGSIRSSPHIFRDGSFGA